MQKFEIIIYTVIITFFAIRFGDILVKIFRTTWKQYKLKDDEVKRIFLIDIDGTVSDDIKNEDSHLYASAYAYTDARAVLNRWYDAGHTITFFTARESKDREVTEQWLEKNGFKYHSLLMDKPRIKDGQEYVWIDNRKVRAVTYQGTWSDLTKVEAEIEVFV
jgi:hypothetical protein